MELLPGAPDVEGQRVIKAPEMKGSMISISGTAAVEAVEADVQTGLIVLDFKLNTTTPRAQAEDDSQSSQNTACNLHDIRPVFERGLSNLRRIDISCP